MRVLECKLTSKRFRDIENKSGNITDHLKSINIPVPSSYKRRKFFVTNGIPWHYQYFNILELPDIEFKYCPYCNWKTKDVSNKSGQFTVHLLTHNKSIDDYLQEFPGETKLFQTYLSKSAYKKQTLASDKNFIKCEICSEPMRKITNSHLRTKHNMTLQEYRLKFSTTLSEQSLEVFREKHRNNLKMHESKFTSTGHAEIRDFIKGLGLIVEDNNKKVLNGVELDIYIPGKNVAIEYNGLFFHSEIGGKKKRKFHLLKSNLAQSKNIHLIHIFEDDWITKKEIIKSKISHVLGCNNSPIIGARKCEIRVIESVEKSKFLSAYHIQGDDVSDVYLGAFYMDELVAVMTFDTLRSMNKSKNKPCEVELRRFATSSNYRVPGIAHKLLNYFTKNYKASSIVSFADRCWSISSENLYTKLGFSLTKRIPPDYKYFNSKISRNNRLHKFGFGKSSLKKRYPEIYSDSKTEWEIMQEAGFDRIWDCGKLKYELTINK